MTQFILDLGIILTGFFVSNTFDYIAFFIWNVVGFASAIGLTLGIMRIIKNI